VERCARCAEQLDGQAFFADFIAGIDDTDPGFDDTGHAGDDTTERLDKRQHAGSAASRQEKFGIFTDRQSATGGDLDGLPPVE
jgi:hypothetical protein